MAQISLYYRTQLETFVSISPDQINADINDNILNNLRTDVEGKSNENGIVLKINKLISYDQGKIDRVNLTGAVIYFVKYECFVCSPTKNLEFVCELENIVKGYILGKNGPLVVIIQLNHVDTQRFELINHEVHYIKKSKNTESKVKLDIGDFLKVSIINVVNNLGENKMFAMCKLINMAKPDEIEDFKRDKALIIGDVSSDDKVYI